jgi:hypothetical protein
MAKKQKAKSKSNYDEPEEDAVYEEGEEGCSRIR